MAMIPRLLQTRVNQQLQDGGQTPASLYFWRTYTGAEIDIIEERGGELFAYECKWNASRGRMPGSFLAAYPDTPYAVISRHQYLDYLGAAASTGDITAPLA